LSAPYCLSS